ncbi:outer membrane beta-barrel protein [Pedobacter xixiisoli]|uniref:Outer membrane receptor proteins, mostly Fe transport n=1 Tax=Pedobacter xixiisoli TaxID=1476464 RepID=A0A286ACM0_9SPHI|nr:outer membrane beta-barrel protein [Pedobacter xixiisoli]SOD19652.1 Outer membrane receptor proteins, mostly Fe transport [Pedobacter xixiisoli]
MKKILLSLLIMLSYQLSFAQKGSVTGKLLDSANNKTTLNFATISVFKGTDTVLHTYKLSDDKGVFKINNLEIGIKYRLVVNAWMYNIHRQEVIIQATQPNVNLGSIFLSEKTNTLNEVVIQSERPPIIVRKDTIEFNAESFKTLPSAVVEDLLKKLPGVSLETDGSILVNGKAVSKILVDGKEFFGGDQQIATKNLPANIIDKVQVSDDPEAKRRDPDLVAANVPQIINLKLKKSIKSGAFGKLYGGGGPRELFEVGGIMNFFRDTTQVSILGYSNNANKPGFSIGDVMRIGGFSRSGVNSTMVNSDGGFSLNGISFGGAMNGGVQTSSGAGANFNTITKKGIKINGKYFLGYAKTLIEQLTDIEQTRGDNPFYINTNSLQNNRNYSHNFGGRIEAKLDSLTKLTIEPNVSIGLARNAVDLKTTTLNSNRELANNADNLSRTKGNNVDYNISTSLWKDFKKAGRSLNLTLNLSQKNNLSDNFILDNFNDLTSNTVRDQWRDNDISNFNANINANYSEPISKSLSLNIATSANYIDNENALATFLRNPSNQAYDIAIPDFTETVMQTGFKTNNRASLRWKVTKDLNIQPGFVFNTIDLENKFTKQENIEQHFNFFAPQLIIKYKNLNFSYSPSFREADVRYLQTVPNNTNSTFIQNGNPNLRPSRTHQVNLNVYKYDTKRTLNYNIYLGGSVQNDGVIMAREVDANLRQISTPVNQDGIWQFHSNGNISKDFKSAKRQITLSAGYWGNYNKSYVIVDNVMSDSRLINGGPRLGARINLNDKFEFGETYSFGFNKSFYENDFYTNLNYYNHGSDTEMIIRFPKKVVWETNYRLQHNTQTVNGQNNTISFWNAAVTFLFMKNDRLQLKCGVNDILNTTNRRYVYLSENSVRDLRINNIGRHGLFTLTYNIQNFGGKVGGKDTMFRF